MNPKREKQSGTNIPGKGNSNFQVAGVSSVRDAYVGRRELAAMAPSETGDTRSESKGITCCGQILGCVMRKIAAEERRRGAAAVKSLKGEWEEPWPKMPPTTSHPHRGQMGRNEACPRVMERTLTSMWKLQEALTCLRVFFCVPPHKTRGGCRPFGLGLGRRRTKS